MNARDRATRRLCESLESLRFAAVRVVRIHGVEFDGSPCNWKEWVALRHAITEAEHTLARDCPPDVPRDPQYTLEPMPRSALRQRRKRPDKERAADEMAAAVKAKEQS